MSSDRKTISNKANGRRSGGPKTLRGKIQSSRNAWRHGLAAASNAALTTSADITRMAKAICGDGYTDPGLYDLAVTIARWQLVLLKVRAVRNSAIEPQGTIDRKLEGVEELPPLPSEAESARLDRYERRARSARNRAIRLFTAMSVCRSSPAIELSGSKNILPGCSLSQPTA
jgi:hypothetical protein